MKIAVLALGISLAVVILLGRPLIGDIISYFAYNKYVDSIEVSSPGGKYVAAGCHLIGGATTTNATLVVIRSRGERLDYAKNNLLFVVDSLGSFNVSWINDHELEVRYAPGPVYT